MLRKLILTVVVLAFFAAPAGATVTSNMGNPADITISLTIPAFVNIWWNTSPASSPDGDDQSILFNDIVQDGSNGGDWWRVDLTGPYGPATKASTDPFAMDYYESYDFANFWLEANANCTMSLISGGDLDNGAGGTLDTWYTIAFTNNSGCTWNVDCGFINGNARLVDGIIPLGGGQGTYGDDALAPLLDIEISGGAFYPLQFSFPMTDAGNTTYDASFLGYVQGTILFHGRVLRTGLSDPSGVYTTTLTVDFTQP